VFQDVPNGPGAFADSDGRSGLVVFGDGSGWTTAYTHLVPGYWGGANFLLYSLPNRGGGLFDVDTFGKFHLHRPFTELHQSWHTILAGSFRKGSTHTDLLFYDKIAGHGQFYTVDGDGYFHKFRDHNWRTGWTYIRAGFFDQNPFFEGLLFYERNSADTELYLTDGSGELTPVDISFASEWAVPWDIIITISRAEVIPIGIPYTSGVCNAQRGLLAMFRIVANS
jgi:hypothetical protein